jgi:hypothetical protein
MVLSDLSLPRRNLQSQNCCNGGRMQDGCAQNSKLRSARNRKRSKRRAIYCPLHNCYIDSVSQKYSLYADKVGQLRQRGIGQHTALLLIKTHTAIPLQGEWLEAFWCDQCQRTEWYYVKKTNRSYELNVAPAELWQQVQGVTHPGGNPSVSEFTLKSSRMVGHQGMKQYQFVGR